MWASRLNSYIVYTKHIYLSRTLARRQLCVANSTLGTKLADQEDALKCMNFSSSFDKWPDENREQVARAFQQMKYMRHIKEAVRVGSPHPELNPQLANLIDEIKNCNISFSTETLIQNSMHPKLRTGIFEVAGPNGILFVLQHDSVDVSLTEHKVMVVCQNYDLTFLKYQRKRLILYDQKGILMASLPDNGIPVVDALDIARKAGAEPYIYRHDSKEKISFEILCNPSDLHQVKRQLESSFIIEEAIVGYKPKSLAEVPASQKSKLADVIVDFSKLWEMQMIYENIK